MRLFFASRFVIDFDGELFRALYRGQIDMNSPVVLCIDDRPELLQLRKTGLESYGFCIESAVSGYAAIKKLEQKLVTAVLVEYKREGMDTEAAAFQIKQRFAQVPIILLAAYFQMPERILWLVDEYVMKSELPDRLVDIIERVTRSTNNKKAHSSALRPNKEYRRNPAA